MKPLILFLLILTPSGLAYSQTDTTMVSTQSAHTLALNLQFSQYKDQFNYGLVFSGPSLTFAYEYSKTNNKRMFNMQSALQSGVNFNKDAGIAVHVKPVSLFYGFDQSWASFTIGAYASVDYQWQLYPQLQSGHVFWLSSFDIGPKLMKNFKFKSQEFRCSISNSLVAITSRPLAGVESYFYTLRLADFIKSGHSNLKLGSLNSFNHSEFRLDQLRKKGKKLSFSYSFEYFGYYQNPKISIVQHSICLNWKIGKSHAN